MTSSGPAPEGSPLRRSSRNRASSNDQSARRRVTRNSARLRAIESGDQNGVDELSVSDPKPNSTTNNAPKRLHSLSEEESSERSPKSRRTAQDLDDQAGQNSGHVDYVGPSAKSNEKVMKTLPEDTIATTSASTGFLMPADSSSAKTMAPAVAAQAPATPRWESLEYSILVQIFQCLYDPCDVYNPSMNRSLVMYARTCKAFAEAALTVLHKSPILTSVSLPKFSSHVAPHSPDNFINYRKIVRTLNIDVTLVAHSHGRARLGVLISNLPLLSHINLRSHKDEFPYRKLEENLRWTYPPEVMAALGMKPGQDSVIKLKSWWWSSRMIDSRELPDVRDVHTRPSFISLESVGFVNFQLPSMQSTSRNKKATDTEKDLQYIEQIAGAISALPHLRRLRMECCTIVEDRFMSLLPPRIRHLELINCWDVTAESLNSYLSSHGGDLQQLTLHHNQSLSLEFLPDLAQNCPNLRALHMNFKYFRVHEFYNDRSPYYADLLNVDQVPTWPGTLEVIELINMQKCPLPAAKNFFQSILDSAPLLLNLRHLELKMNLDIAWRARSEFRDYWVPKIQDVFLRKSDGPKDFYSLSDRPWLERPETPPSRSRRVVATPSRRSTRTTPRHGSGPSSRSNGSTRGLRTQNRPDSYRDPDTDVDDSTAESESEQSSPTFKAERKDRRVIHGMCDIVHVSIDNSKPSEVQYDMEDFLDDGEHSDTDEDEDEEWNSDSGEVDETYAW